jgi:hypothetical protein
MIKHQFFPYVASFAGITLCTFYCCIKKKCRENKILPTIKINGFGDDLENSICHSECSS